MFDTDAIQKIQRKANGYRFFRYCLRNIALYIATLSVLWLLSKRIVGTEFSGFWIGLPIPVLVSLLQWRRNPVLREQALLWAECRLGGQGMLLLGQLGDSADWDESIRQYLSAGQENLRPKFSLRTELSQLGLAGVFLMLCAWVPLRHVPQSQKDSALILQEKSALLEENSALEEILPDNEQLEELREQIRKIDPQENVEAGLEALDAISTQQEQILQKLERSLQQTQQLLEQDYVDPAQLEEQVSPVEPALPEQLQQQLQEQQYSLSEEQKQQLSEALQKTAQQLAEQSNKLSNEQLQELAKKSEQSGEGEGEEKEGGEDENKGDSSKGEPCDPADESCTPSTGGGESTALTFGEKRMLDSTASPTEAIRTDKQVDWENTVQLGQGQGLPEQGFRDQYQEGSGGMSSQSGSAPRQNIPPNQRKLVQRFFTAEKGEEK